MARYRGRHRAPSSIDLGSTGRALARTALAGAVAGAPLAVAAPAAHAAAESTWDRVAQCESGGRWNINTGNGYHGGLQFLPATWNGFGGRQFAPVAHQATRAQQIAVAERVLAKQGWNAWPTCSRKAGARGEGAAQRGAPAAAPTQIRLSAPATTGSYVIKRGDTLFKIAAKHRVAGGWKALVQKNPALARNPHKIFPGMRVTV